MRFMCYMRVADQEDNWRICDFIINSGFRVTCKKDLAKKHCDENICYKIQEEWKQPNCFDAVQEHRRRGRCPEE